jgi:fructokinase
MKVLAFGEILWDVIEGNEHLGGAPFNFAAHVAKCGNESHIISRLGNDYRGMNAFNRCKLYGVGDLLIQWDEQHPTGIVEIILDAGQPDYNINENVAYDFIEISDTFLKMDKNKFDVFYFGSLSQRNPVSATTLKYVLEKFTFNHIFYDVNLRKNGYSASIIENSLRYCSILKLNMNEVPIISSLLFSADLEKENFCRSIRSFFQGVSEIVITASDKGCFIFHDNTLQYVPGKEVQVNDAVGAGDAFSAAFMHVLCNGGSPMEAADIANQLGAYVTTQRGAIPEYTAKIGRLLEVKPKGQSHAPQIIL